MDVEAALVHAVAPRHLADAIVGDLCERRAALARTLGEKKASAVYRADAFRSLPSLAVSSAGQALTDNWIFALAAAALIWALCVAAIPVWDQVGLGGVGYHVLRLAGIGLILGGTRRASTLSCAFLLVLIGISNCAIDAREAGSVWGVLSESTYYCGLLLDGAAMASMLIALRIARVVRMLGCSR
jgi:hypothetical protein